MTGRSCCWGPFLSHCHNAAAASEVCCWGSAPVELSQHGGNCGWGRGVMGQVQGGTVGILEEGRDGSGSSCSHTGIPSHLPPLPSGPPPTLGCSAHLFDTGAFYNGVSLSCKVHNAVSPLKTLQDITAKWGWGESCALLIFIASLHGNSQGSWCLAYYPKRSSLVSQTAE